jgi:ribosomal-protein-alanine N-acetyltransferase
MMKSSLRRELAPPIGFRLQSGRVILRCPEAQDWREWAKLRSDSRAFLAPWEPIWSVDSLSQPVFDRRLKRIYNEWRQDEGYNFHVYDRATNLLVGGIGLNQVKRGIAQSGIIGYWVGERYARQGFTEASTRLVTSFAFETLGLHRVEATCIPTNEASKRLLAKLGFQQEGYARQYLKIAGEWADHLLFAMIREEWKG